MKPAKTAYGGLNTNTITMGNVALNTKEKLFLLSQIRFVFTALHDLKKRKKMKITIEIEADSVLRDIRSLRINSHGKCFAANYDNDPNKLVVTAIDKALWLLNDLFIHESVERWDERTKEERR